MICPSCGTELPADALFCGECGRALGARPAVAQAARDTVILERGILERASDVVPPRPDPFPWGEPPVPAGAAVPSETAVGSETPVLPDHADQPMDAVPDGVADAPESPMPAAPELVGNADDVEPTRILPRGANGQRFVLQFSTGESITVFGTGLLGRNPQPQPGEYFDQLVAISDPGKSVSKTHLEFGQEAGTFWVSDRFSGNGSLVREPESQPRRCEPGKRYRVVRGSRIDIGEQFLIVS